MKEKNKAFVPFWNEKTEEATKKLWLPSNTKKRKIKNKRLNTWFSTKGIFSGKNTTTIQPLEDTEDEITKVIKIKLNPTKKQKELLQKFNHTVRFIYNKTKEIIDTEKIYNKFELQKRVVAEKSRESKLTNPLYVKHKWLAETPKVMRKHACDSCVTAYKAAFTNLKNNNINKFDVRFKTKKREKSWTLGIEKSLQFKNNKLKILSTFLGEIRYYKRCLKKFDLDLLFKDGKPKHDCTINYKYKDYFLLIPYKCKKKKSNSESSCSIDPGVRKFATVYTPEDEKVYFLGIDSAKKLEPLLLALDRKISTLATLTTAIRDGKEREKERKKYKRKKLSLLKRISNLKAELHHKIANFLTKKFSTIITPHFESKQMSQSDKLKTKVVRNMMNLGHCKFLDRLKFKCNERSVKICIIPEDYTTKTCGCCGTINNIGSSEIFNCSNCKLKTDRDLNAARNEYLKFLTTVS